MKVPHSMCSHSSARCDALSHDDLLLLCIPARSVHEEDWIVVSASKCRPSVNDIACIPRLHAKFQYYSLERGSTHIFDLRPPWFLIAGVTSATLLITVCCTLCAMLAFCGYLFPALVSFGLIFLLPGILELICAFAYTMSTRSFSSHVDPSESLIWWVLAVTSIIVGFVIIFREDLLLSILPLGFLLNGSAALVQHLVILRDSPTEVPWLRINSWGSTGIFLIWFILNILRKIVLRRAKQAISGDYAAYQCEWEGIMENFDSTLAVRDLDDIVKSGFGSADRLVRPLQLMGEQPQHSLLTNDAALIHPLSCMPIAMNERPPACKQMIAVFGFGVASSTYICSSLDTLYVQAYALEPIFNLKVQQLAKLADGEFVCRSANHGSHGSTAAAAGDFHFVTADQWNRMGGVKPVDRAIEKVVRVYHGNVSLLLDVVRQCIVFDRMRDMLKVMRIILDDSDVEVLRIKNRMSNHYDVQSSGGYRDVLVNLRINTLLTRKLGLNNHVCELQLILKNFMVHRTLEGHTRYVAFRNKRCE